MKNKILLAILIFCLAISLTAYMRFQPQNTETQQNEETIPQSNSDPNPVQENNEQDEETPETEKITEQQLAQHNSKSDCWISYDEKVYDLTSFLPQHPGSSAAIEPHCGTSSSFKQAFEKQHGTSKVKNLMRVGVLIGDFDVVGQSA